MFSTPFVFLFALLLSLPLLLLFAPHFNPLSSSSSSTSSPTSISPQDELDDLHLFRRAASLSSSSHSHTTSLKLGESNPRLKIAFLFLTNSDLVFAPLWQKFFAGNERRFNIYIHSDPTIRITPPSGVFHNRFIDSKRTYRGSPTLISAARRLLATAIIDDSKNAYFALLSQSCIPIHSFNYVYNLLFQHPPSFFKLPFTSRNKFKFTRPSYIEILSNEPTLPDRYVARGEKVMLPEVKFEEFKVGSQFFVLNKKHALTVVKDLKLWRKFKLPCLNVDSCYPEEHYFPTLLAMEDAEGCSGYTLTRVNWTESVGGHPHMYGKEEVSAELIRELRVSNFSSDYVFARKFAEESLGKLMELADEVIFKD